MGEATVRRVTVTVDARKRVRFEVQDTGPGIALSAQASIFEPYVRLPHRREPGVGLGLATVKRLVEAHGGAVGVHSASTGGSLFWFELPRAPA
jgi:signal transduction histidine kinase